MLISCARCGKVHKHGECSIEVKKKKYKKRPNKADEFRRTAQWQRKRKEMLERDKYLCRVCLAGTHPIGTRPINTENIQVHHIEPIVKAWKKRLDDDNLICLCPYHHYMADHGDIATEELKLLAKQSPLQNFEESSRDP